ncbi:MAG: ABC transporter substrate-binding protein [Oscillospiraceae bacterium]|jgi:peptide/nickel transport system substrate-binding protein|nr:ABC transporter substrate-binding protein [Oscillospiraceae bacterium]
MKKTGILALCLAAALCLGALSACSSGNTQGDGAPPSASSPAPSGADSPAADSAKVYYMTTNFEESWWDPALFMQINDVSLAPMIYETLVELQTDGTVAPQLAESWDISDGGLTYTFNLRKGVQWHKGYGEFTSADVKFTLERQTDPAVASVNADNLNIANIAAIECPDEYTVVFKLKAADVDLLTRMSLYYSIIVCKAHSDKDGVASINSDPIGTGPFVYDGGTLGIKTEAVRNTEWWGDFTGNVDRVVSTFMSDTNTIYMAFDKGELHSTGLYDKDKIKEYEDKGYPVVNVPLLQLLYVGVNMQLEPFDNPVVREAFFNAIDVQYFLDNLYYGTESAVGSYVPPSSKYALTDYFKFNYDPERSKQLLAEAGYPDGVEVTLWGASDALGQPPAILTQDQLGKAGFKVNLQCVDFGVFIDQVRNGTAQMWVLYNTTGAIADDTINRYTSKSYPGSNWCGVTDAEYDALVEAGLNAKTEQEKYDSFYAAQRRLMDLQVIYPISTFSVGEVMQKNVSGYKSYGDLGFRLQTVTIG